MAKEKSDIGLIGLALMGQNLALNIADHGFQISVYNRTLSKIEKFLAANPDTPGGLVGESTLEKFVGSLSLPRKIIILVRAGPGIDAVIEALIPFLNLDDIIIDGGNSNWIDTIRREKNLAQKGFRYIGLGVSGGEEGARYGPSLMPGGAVETCRELDPIWKLIAAKVDPESGKPAEGGFPCTAYIGENGAGHYVKMIHNGIEYSDMQIICEAYDLMRTLLHMAPLEIGEVFSQWNNGLLDSFLIQITADILKQRDPDTSASFVDIVLDTAGQKGTGKWTSVNALNMGICAPTIAEAVFARYMSAIKSERVTASKVLKGPTLVFGGDSQNFISSIHDALYCSKICSYAQGFQLMREAENEYDWKLKFGEIAQIWRGGCIIRAAFLQKITEAFDRNPELANLLLDPYFKDAVENAQKNWRKVVAIAVQHGAAIPTISSALAYYDGYRAPRLPQNLLQAQRDYFGAHTYERTDQPRDKFYHIDWLDPKRPQYEA